MALIEKSLVDIIKPVISNVYPVVIPDKANYYPCVTYKLINTLFQKDMGSNIIFKRNNYQLDLYASKYADVKALANSLLGALLQSEQVISVTNTFDSIDDAQVQQMYRVTMTVYLYES